MAKRRNQMAKSKSRQPEDQQKTHKQPESSAEPTKSSSSKPLAKGFVVDDSPGQQIFVGGLPGKPTKATEARLWPVPEGWTVMDDKPESHIFVGGVKPSKKLK